MLANNYNDVPGDMKKTLLLHNMDSFGLKIFKSFNIKLKDVTLKELLK